MTSRSYHNCGCPALRACCQGSAPLLHRTRPCTKRKDGAPTVLEREKKNNHERIVHPPADRYTVSVLNYFGKWAEDKDAAITFRDRHLIPAIQQGKRVDLDFRDVETAPHSFLNALLANEGLPVDSRV